MTAAETAAQSPAMTVVGLTLTYRVVPEDWAFAGKGTSASVVQTIASMLLTM